MEVNKARFLWIIHVTIVLLVSTFQSGITLGNETDRLALLAFRNEVTSDPLEALSAWNDSLHYCNWSGIMCSSQQQPSRVTIMDLGSKSLVGLISPHIGNLTSLESLNLHKNSFAGGIPGEIGHLSRLRFLDLSYNQLSGLIPSNICNNTKLEKAHFGMNRLQGKIPPSLGDCHSLQYLSLSQNQLTGTVPKPVMGVSSLSFLDLSANILSGTLPYEVDNLDKKIVYLDLSKNHISGNIPSYLGKCLGLQNLYLQGNLFDGAIPSSFESLYGTQVLDLSRNHLSGKIPEFLGSFNSLKYLNLSFNDFQGEVPKQGVFKNISAFSILGNSKLCGEIPLLHLPSCQRPIPDKKQSKHFHVKLLIIISAAVLFAVFYCMFLVFIWRAKAQKVLLTSSESPLGDMFQKVSYNELLNATNGFSKENLVGVGSYGSVYRGVLTLNQETTIVVAVKVFNLQRRGTSKSFMAECQALRYSRHRNLVKILTSCSSVDFKGNEFKSLVLEFMPNGSLENWLHPTSDDEQLHRSTRRSLSFMERLDIAIDIASALDYLHRQCQTPVIHCDLKPSNVLLDDGMIAHIGDFGLAKFLDGIIISAESESHTSSLSVGIRGTIGYAAPEYGMGREISKSGDIYSFGIMLLELFTGRRPTDDMFKGDLSLHSFAATSLLTDRVMQIVDPILLVPLQFQNQQGIEDLQMMNGDMEAKLCEALTRILKLAVMCSTESPKERMEIVPVLKMLQSIKKLYFCLKIGYIVKKEGKGYNHLQERRERIYNSEFRIMKSKCSEYRK